VAGSVAVASLPTVTAPVVSFGEGQPTSASNSRRITSRGVSSNHERNGTGPGVVNAEPLVRTEARGEERLDLADGLEAVALPPGVGQAQQPSTRPVLDARQRGG
jgi:hypothetical protein